LQALKDANDHPGIAEYYNMGGIRQPVSVSERERIRSIKCTFLPKGTLGK